MDSGMDKVLTVIVPVYNMEKYIRQCLESLVIGEVLDRIEGEASLFIGAEGGFDESEVELALSMGIPSLTLGPRILRCETAPMAALSVLMYHTGNMN